MAALVVLVVIVAVTVALCMKRKRAMKNKEGYEPANEKEASWGSELWLVLTASDIMSVGQGVEFHRNNANLYIYKK